MKAVEMRNLETGTLEVELEKRKRELLELRGQVALGEEVHPHRLKILRKEIARILTVQRERKVREGGEAA